MSPWFKTTSLIALTSSKKSFREFWLFWSQLMALRKTWSSPEDFGRDLWIWLYWIVPSGRFDQAFDLWVLWILLLLCLDEQWKIFGKCLRPVVPALLPDPDCSAWTSPWPRAPHGVSFYSTFRDSLDASADLAGLLSFCRSHQANRVLTSLLSRFVFWGRV